MGSRQPNATARSPDDRPHGSRGHIAILAARRTALSVPGWPPHDRNHGDSFVAYGAAFRGGVRVAVADVNDDGVSDIITAPGPGGGPDIRVFDGVTGAVIREFLAYDSSFTGGVFVAATCLDGDHKADIITGAGAGGGPHVKAFSGATGDVFSSFMAYDQSFRGGVSVAGIPSYLIGNSDIPSQIVTGAGPGGAPHVRLFNALTGALGSEFMAFDQSLRGGVNVAAGAETGFGARPLIATAQASGAPPAVRIYISFFTTNRLDREFLPYGASTFAGGVTLAFDPFENLLTGTGRGGLPLVLQWRMSDLTLERSVYAFDPAFLGGVFVG